MRSLNLLSALLLSSILATSQVFAFTPANPNGSATSANSAPVVIASDQAAVAVSAASLPLPSGAATSSNQTAGNTSLATVATNTGNIPAKGSATSANSTPVVIASDQAALPLPTGAATATNQTTANTSLASIVTSTANIPASPAQQGATKHLTITPTVTAGAYTTGQVVGGLISLTNANRASGLGGLVQYVSIDVKTALTAPYDVYFFDTQPTNGTYTDNATFALNVADLPFKCGVVHVNDLSSDGTPQTLQAAALGLPFALPATTLYAVIVIRGGQTFASTSAVVLNVMVRQD